MKSLISVCAIVAFCATTSYAAPLPACRSQDAHCWKDLLDQQLTIDDSLRRELDLKDQLLKSKDAEIATKDSALASQKDALNAMAPGLKAGERSALESPTLWFGIGFGVGAALTIGLTVLGVWAQSQLAHAR